MICSSASRYPEPPHQNKCNHEVTKPRRRTGLVWFSARLRVFVVACKTHMRTREQDVEPFVNLSELTEIELLILRRMREFTIGEHRSLFHGSGFDFVGLRDVQGGDPPAARALPQCGHTQSQR